MMLLATTDTFALAPDTEPARRSAQSICDKYRAAGLDDLTCNVEVSWLLVDPPGQDAPTLAAWWAFLLRDKTRTSPGFTAHGAVTVSAHSAFHPLFMPVLTHERALDITAKETAVLVTGP